ncbi:MAG: MerR family DNA-binding protein [Acinetobacter sp.]|nr:MerR family DNA-binding protein [Acinetobacter sp.]
MSSSKNQFYKIKQLSELLQISVETIRYYEKMGLLSAAVRQNNGYRLFTQHHVEQLNFIKHCRYLDFSLDEIARLIELKNNPTENCRSADDLVKQHLARIDEKIAQLMQMKQELLMMNDCQENQSEHCKVIHHLVQQE